MAQMANNGIEGLRRIKDTQRRLRAEAMIHEGFANLAAVEAQVQPGAGRLDQVEDGFFD